MTNTVAHTPLKRGTSRRLGLRLPTPKHRVCVPMLAERHRAEEIDPGSNECCHVMHTWDAVSSSWLPGCAHLGSV